MATLCSVNCVCARGVGSRVFLGTAVLSTTGWKYPLPKQWSHVPLSTPLVSYTRVEETKSQAVRDRRPASFPPFSLPGSSIAISRDLFYESSPRECDREF